MERKRYFTMIKEGLEQFPVVALLGPRQVGKTTLATEYLQEKAHGVSHFLDLEDPEILFQLSDPKLVLSKLSGLVVIDEIQRKKELFPLIRVLADRRPVKTRFLILGSASAELINQSSESLAGRIRYIEVRPFTFGIETDLNLSRLWVRGGFPLAYTADSDSACFLWLEQFIRTFLERDLGQLGFNFPSELMRRFWLMLTHYHGQTLNASEIGKSLDLSDMTIKRYFDALVGTFMLRRLSPWFENISKRQVKQPKIYFRDSGIFHRLLGIKEEAGLLLHPRLGASWEGFAIEQIIAHYDAMGSESYYWGVHGQMELDLLIVKDGKRHGFEIKHTTAPKLPSHYKQIRALLKLDSFDVVHAGTQSFPLSPKITAYTLQELLSL